ncbi:hypothetical protein PMKS-002982 [Pichia membranifaciens]|uniref:Amino acid transporter transmembrane domain-containing protein n=1 Tax=Pichia membranifaciens TaxID=4926 RepID=A0A1Q2YJ32_9ASCO|nr:hypothetical protein PMKS-002982 [Pichia membranifaciens]
MSSSYTDLPQLDDMSTNEAPYNDIIEDESSMIDRLHMEEGSETLSYPMQLMPPPESRGSDLKSAFFNMTNSIVGAGIVGIPKAFLNSGLIAGALLMIILTFLNDWTLRLIIVNTKLSGTKSYTGFVTHSYGTVGKIIVLLSQGLFALGGSIELVGATSGSTLAYILPPLCHNKMTKENKTFRQQAPHYACMIFGVAVMVLSSSQTIIESLKESPSAGHCVE